MRVTIRSVGLSPTSTVGLLSILLNKVSSTTSWEKGASKERGPRACRKRSRESPNRSQNQLIRLLVGFRKIWCVSMDTKIELRNPLNLRPMFQATGRLVGGPSLRLLTNDKSMSSTTSQETRTWAWSPIKSSTRWAYKTSIGLRRQSKAPTKPELNNFKSKLTSSNSSSVEYLRKFQDIGWNACNSKKSCTGWRPSSMKSSKSRGISCKERKRHSLACWRELSRSEETFEG